MVPTKPHWPGVQSIGMLAQPSPQLPEKEVCLGLYRGWGSHGRGALVCPGGKVGHMHRPLRWSRVCRLSRNTRRPRMLLRRAAIATGVAALTNRLLSKVSMKLMSWRWSAQLLVRVLPHPMVARILTPVFTQGFLTSVLYQEDSAIVLSSFLCRQNVALGVAQLLRHHGPLAGLCEDPYAPAIIASIARSPGLGTFFLRFLEVVDPMRMAQFMEYPQTAKLIAAVVCSSDPVEAAACLHKQRAVIAQKVVQICRIPSTMPWGVLLISSPGFDHWMGGFLGDQHGAEFARQVMVTPGFEAYVETFIGFDDVKAFVISLLQRPLVCNFVTWLNKDREMRLWFAHIASRDSSLAFLTEMLLQPGLDRFIVQLLLMPGNDAALRVMLEHWVRAEGSLKQVIQSFTEKPLAAEALARVTVSPGFIDAFVLRRLLLQPGLAEVVVDAVVLVGLRGLVETVLPFGVSTLALSVLLLGESAGERLTSLVEELPVVDQVAALMMAL